MDSMIFLNGLGDDFDDVFDTDFDYGFENDFESGSTLVVMTGLWGWLDFDGFDDGFGGPSLFEANDCHCHHTCMRVWKITPCDSKKIIVARPLLQLLMT